MENIIVFRAWDQHLERVPIVGDNLDSVSAKLGQGTYTVFRLYPGRGVFHLQQHLDRLRTSAHLLGKPFPLKDAWLREVIQKAVDRSGMSQARVRLTIPFATPEQAFITLERYQPPAPEVYQQGVRVGLVQAERENPEAKDTHFIAQRKELLASQPGVYELLLINDQGEILEGLSSNFFARLTDGLHTAREGVLEGITRQFVLRLAEEIIPVILTPITISQLPEVDEAFITSSSPGIIPVVQVGKQVIGTGKPGALTLRLRELYTRRLEEELEEV